MYERLQNVHFMKNRKIYYCISIAIIVIMLAIGLLRGFNWGIDFTGGTLIQIDMGEKADLGEVDKVLEDNGIDAVVIYAGDESEQIIIKTSESLETESRSRLMDSMEKAFDLEDDALQSVENIGPSVGDSLRSSAVKSVIAAIVLMLIYIAIRFMWKYGIASILALLNTILIMIGFYGAFHISINSPFIAAVLTVLGYGINDTIVIFDRIRENTGGRKVRRSIDKVSDLVDESIRQTVGRSLMTSLTTIAVMVPIIIICGDTIRSFILPILVGVIASTCSSIFIAPALWFDIMRATDKDSYGYKQKQKEKDRKRQDKEKVRLEKEKAKALEAKKKQDAQKEAERQRRKEERERKKAAEKAKAEEKAQAAAEAEKGSAGSK